MSEHTPLISIVAPVYNEEAVLQELYDRLSAIMDALPYRHEIVFINDGSRDSSLEILMRLKMADPAVALINFSRNFGKEAAMTAGFDHAKGDAVIVVDSDLQDPPELIPDLIEPWRNDEADVVVATRSERAGETWLKKATAKGFYRIMSALGTPITPDTGDFRLMSRQAVDALGTLRERNRFMKGLFAWIGFREKKVMYKRDARAAGTTSFNYWKLWNFALDGFTSFTMLPLKVASYLGIGVGLFAILYAIGVVIKTLIFGDPVAGYPSLMVVVLLLGAIQLMSIGVIGEYLARAFLETKQRPLYIVQDHLPSEQKPNPALTSARHPLEATHR